MDRRQFLKKTLSAGIYAGTALTVGGVASPSFGGIAYPDLAAVMGAEPDVMFDKGVQALGGMSRFVKPGQKVVVKPNIGWDTVPERAANTNPALIKQIIKQCLGAGAGKVYVFDHTCDSWKRCYASSGIQHAVKEAGGLMVPGNAQRHYSSIEVPKGRILKNAFAHELFLEADVFINVPVLKNHSATGLTIGMKNLMGVVWDRGWWHRNNLHQCIADFITFRKPDLTVVDAYRILRSNGPRGVSEADAEMAKALIMSPDPVAADSAAAKLFGMEPAQIRYIVQANALGAGEMDLSKIAIQKIRA